MNVIAMILSGFGLLIALANLWGMVWSALERKKGNEKNFSVIPLISLGACILGFIFAPDYRVYYLIPTLIDPATLFLPYGIWLSFRVDHEPMNENSNKTE